MTNSFHRSHNMTRSQGANKQNSAQHNSGPRSELKGALDTHSTSSLIQYGTPYQFTPSNGVHYGVPRQVFGSAVAPTPYHQYSQPYIASRYIQPYYAPYFRPHAQSFGSIIANVASTEIHQVPSFQNPSSQYMHQQNLVQIPQHNQVLTHYNLQSTPLIQPNPYGMVYTGYCPNAIPSRGSYISPVAAINAIPTANHVYPKHYHWQNSSMSPNIQSVVYHPAPPIHHHMGFHQPAKCMPALVPPQSLSSSLTTPQSTPSQSPLENFQTLHHEIKTVEEIELHEKLKTIPKPKSFSTNQMDVFRAQVMAYSLLVRNKTINESLSTILLASKKQSTETFINSTSNKKVMSPKNLATNSPSGAAAQAPIITTVAVVTTNGRQTA